MRLTGVPSLTLLGTKVLANSSREAPTMSKGQPRVALWGDGSGEFGVSKQTRVPVPGTVEIES
jgi:hypothetical protein